jgi:signal transduction histidine kinase
VGRKTTLKIHHTCHSDEAPRPQHPFLETQSSSRMAARRLMGFNLKKIAALECLGLAGMRERASLLGGSLEIRSRLGKGTKVYFRLPVSGSGDESHDSSAVG